MRSAARFLIAMSLAAAIAPAWAQRLELIPLKYRAPEEVIPLLQPMLDPEGSIEGQDNVLAIRTSPENLKKLKKALARLDVEPRRLMIYVRQDARGSGEQRALEVRGTVGNRHWSLTNENGPTDRRGATARVSESFGEGEEESAQMVRAVEGRPALIQIGGSQPMVTRTVAPGGAVTESVTFHEASTGFEVVPRVSGRRVTLEISSRREGFRPDGGVRFQRVSSTAVGKLGEWFQLGGSSRRSVGKAAGLLSYNDSMSRDLSGVWVKVEEVQ
ncbi:MAG: hypothetical protein HY922_03140 [Elusimicrobia bacterium]|nr:hypothetical protein [Elusimicrobiota bacterium]